MKLLFALMYAAILSGSCHARNESDVQTQVYLERIVGVDGETTYPDPLLLDIDKQVPRNLTEAIERLMEMMPLNVTDSIKSEAAKSCEFASSERWTDDFHECSEVVCRALPKRSQELECGYLTRVNEWVEKQWLGGLCVETARKESRLFSWFASREVTECFQMSEVITAATYRKATGLPVNQLALIEAVR